MSTIGHDLAVVLCRELEGFKRELELFPDDESVWRTAPGVTNSAANLALHVAGGLQHVVGRVLGHGTYVRDRDAEFSRRAGPRSEVVAELDRASAVIRHVLPSLSQQAMESDYPQPVIAGVTFTTRMFLLHLCAHAAMHLGQAGYLRRLAMADERSSGPLPLAALNADVVG